MTWLAPQYFWLLLLLPFPFLVQRKRREAAVLFSSFRLLPPSIRRRRRRLRHILPPVLRFFVLLLGIVALARPVKIKRNVTETVEGIDIVLVMDVSSSMSARDLGRRTRLETAKEVIKEFIGKRPNDRIGLVVFSGRAFTQAPLTLDHDLVATLVDSLKIGMIEDGTAIGTALGTAVSRLRTSKARSKVVILLTDGDNNAGVLDPLTAAELARQFSVKVYTIGLGSESGYRFTQRDPATGRLFTGLYRFNPRLLRRIAQITTGSEAAYFNATSEEELRQIYDTIDALEKTAIEVKRFEKRDEYFAPFLFAAVLLLTLEIVLTATVFRRVPL
ncbi:MAG: VWA domain-containing protein [Candidatus Hydrogenedentota bacterium]|nr:MAG: VWA domain-containing protein [Candidatus Hydrogenedentota bacterium]